MKNSWNNMIPFLPLQEFMPRPLFKKALYLRSMFHLLCRLPSCDLDTSPSSTQVAPTLDLH
ncbi:hypothetical protein BHE74_00047724 [Ensete ventricosum]|uniref:Uncharacterized protein n=1 Tax=Ensete ventricosum TaxID=4639 RepID=A0A445M9H6_ENSVE|nr:hypothetical protein BHE74_00047724 [Ensete ventricosum]RZR70878.1 hypothetical protein BHM03_00002013 [Ensete ventricosum]